MGRKLCFYHSIYENITVGALKSEISKKILSSIYSRYRIIYNILHATYLRQKIVQKMQYKVQ